MAGPLKKSLFCGFPKTVSDRDIYFIKAVLLLCTQEHFSLNFASHGQFDLSPPLHILIGLTICFAAGPDQEARDEAGAEGGRRLRNIRLVHNSQL